MGTGIVSIALSLDRHETLSRVLLVLGSAAWVALGLVFVARLFEDRERVRDEARSPVALTAVAGTAVIGARFTLLGWTWAGFALLGVAVTSWAALLTPVLRHWTTPTIGVSLMLTVATESLAVLSSSLAEHAAVRWLLYAALAPFLLGLAFYASVMSRFDFRQLVTGSGDHWITGGALAIATLAAGRFTLGAEKLGVLRDQQPGMRHASLALWALTMAWLPVLVVAEVARPRLRYDVRRWSTVFPVGMYAVCSFVVGGAANSGEVVRFARVWVWAAVAVWAVVVVATVRRGGLPIRGESPRASGQREWIA
jgi:tellurite resistance protein TehA-like permease